MDGDGVSVGEAVLAEFLAGEAFEAAVVHADRHRTVAEIDGFDDAAFAGDDLAVGSGREGDDEVTGGVPGDGFGDVAGSQLGQGLSLPGVVLADVLGEDVDLAVVAVEDRSERAPGADGVELAVVTDEDDLGAGDVGGGEEPEHGGVVGHPGFVEDDDVAGGQIEGVVVEAPE